MQVLSLTTNTITALGLGATAPRVTIWVVDASKETLHVGRSRKGKWTEGSVLVTRRRRITRTCRPLPRPGPRIFKPAAWACALVSFRACAHRHLLSSVTVRRGSGHQPERAPNKENAVPCLLRRSGVTSTCSPYPVTRRRSEAARRGEASVPVLGPGGGVRSAGSDSVLAAQGRQGRAPAANRFVRPTLSRPWTTTRRRN